MCPAECWEFFSAAIPHGIIVRWENTLFVERQVNAIFDCRARVLAKYFTE